MKSHKKIHKNIQKNYYACNSKVLHVYFLVESFKYTFNLIINQTRKSWDFSKYPGIHPGPK